MKLQAFVLAFLITLPPLAAQSRRKPAPKPGTPAPPVQAWPVATISVKGNRIYPEAAIIQATGLKIGQKAGQAEFDTARDRLLATGAFATVGYKFNPGPGGYAAVFDVTEVAQAFPWKFEALDADEAALRKAVQSAEPLFAVKMPGTDQALQRVTKIVQTALAAQGKTEPVVAKLTAESGDQLAIVFRPSSLPAVAEVKFQGNKSIDTRTLQQAMSGAAIGSIYSDKRFQELLDLNIRPLYEAQGRVRVRFPRLKSEPAKDVKGLIVTVGIEEGEVYQLGDVAVQGVASPREMVKEAALKSNEPFNGAEVQAAVNRVKQRMQSSGYIKAEASVDRRIDDAKKRVDILIKLAPGPQYSFGKLSIQGLNIQTEPHIRKLWTLKPGAPFNAAYPDLFLARIREEGLFEDLGETRSERKVNENDRIVDVTLHFASTGKALPAIGAARDEIERQERRKKEYPK